MTTLADPVPVTTLLEELRTVIDERETISTRDSVLSARKLELEHALIGYHETTGLTSVKGGGMTVSFDDDALRAKYDPEKWQSIMQWAVQSGHDYIVQRRLTDAKVIALIKDGVELPEGLSLESFCKISTRRI